MVVTQVLADRTNQQDAYAFTSPIKKDRSQKQPDHDEISEDELCRSLSHSLCNSDPTSPESDRLPSPFVSINPSLLGDSRWQYRDLQKLCMQLGLGGRGNRAALLDKLRRWHRTEFDVNKQAVPSEDACLPSNFTLLDLGISDLKSDESNPELTPLTSRPHRNPDGTPKSILSEKRRSREQANDGKRRLSFSMFNGVCLIPSRHQQKFDTEPYENEQPTNPSSQSSPPRVPMPRVGGR